MKALVLDLITVALLTVVCMVVIVACFAGWSLLLTNVSLAVCFGFLAVLGSR